MKKYTILLFSLIISYSAYNQIHTVPGDFSDIQTAINNASENDTILISQNTYLENLIIDKPITLASNFIFDYDSHEFISSTIIDGNSVGTTITIENIDTDTVRIIGLTITGGSGTLADPQNLGPEVMHGGGLFIDTVHAVKIEHCYIEGNELITDHNSAGGIMCSNSFLSIYMSDISNNTIKGSSAFGEGGGLYLYESEAVINTCEFENNNSEVAYGEGGGIFAKNSILEIQNSIFNLNKNINGGGIYAKNTEVQIYNTDFTNNYATQASAIYVYNDTNLPATFDEITVFGNSSPTNNNVGAFSLFRTIGSITNSDFEYNSSGLGAGAISISSSEIAIDNCVVSGNISESGIGGEAAGLKIYQSDVNISNSEISYNHCLPAELYNEGGGIFASYSSVMLDSVLMVNNTSGRGGAINLMSSDLMMTRCELVSNSANEGSVIYAYGSDIAIISSTITQNTAVTGGFLLQQSNFIALNSILWDNATNEIIAHEIGDPSNIHIAFTDIMGGEPGIITNSNANLDYASNNLNTDPMFADDFSWDFDLQATSPLVNAGVAYYEYNSEVIIDFTDADYSGSAPDIGAHETVLLGIPQFTHIDLLRVYPNPATDFIYFELSEQINKIQIYDISGKLLEVPIDYLKNRIDVHNLPQGRYTISILLENRVLRGGFVRM